MALQDPNQPSPMNPPADFDWNTSPIPPDALEDQGVQRIGNNGVVEETAGPTPRAQVPVDLAHESTDPARAEAPPLQGTVAYALSQGDKVSTSSRGITDAGIAKTRQLSGFAGVDGRTDAMMAPQLAQSRQTGADIKAGVGKQQDAVQQHMDAESDWHKANSELQDRISDFYQLTGQVEERMRGEAKAEREQYIGAYREQLAGVKQLMAQDANPLHGLSKGSVLGLGAAAFAQGFLAAQGININVTGQIDTWVNRELEQHQSKIKNLHNAAQDQLSLYQIARQTSSDDAEARDKMRGFVIEGFKSKIAMESERFQSDAARAKAKERIAQLDIELASTMNKLADKYYDDRLKTRSAIVQEVSSQGQLAIQGAQLALSKQREAREVRKEQDAALEKFKSNIVYDNSRKMMPKVDKDGKPVLDTNGKPVMQDMGGGGRARWLYKHGIDDKEKQEYRKAQASHNHLSDLMEEYGSLYRKHGNMSITDIGRLNSTDAARMRQVQNEILSSYALQMSGKAVTDKEIERLKTSLPEAVFGTAAKVDQIISQTNKHWTDRLDKQRYEIADVIPDRVQDSKTGQMIDNPVRQWKTDNRSHFNEVGYAENTANSESGGKLSDSTTSIAIKAMTRPDSYKPADGKVFKTSDDKEVDMSKLDIKSAQGDWRQFSMSSKASLPSDVPNFAVGTIALVKEAKGGNKQAAERLLTIMNTDWKKLPNDIRTDKGQGGNWLEGNGYRLKTQQDLVEYLLSNDQNGPVKIPPVPRAGAVPRTDRQGYQALQDDPVDQIKKW